MKHIGLHLSKLMTQADLNYLDILRNSIKELNKIDDFPYNIDGDEYPVWIARLASIQDISYVCIRNIRDLKQVLADEDNYIFYLSIYRHNIYDTSIIIKEIRELEYSQSDIILGGDKDAFELLINDLGISKEGIRFEVSLNTDINNYKVFEDDILNNTPHSFIPRLGFTKGCTNKCTFCIVPSNYTRIDSHTVNINVDILCNTKGLIPYIYIDDKAFGQNNYVPNLNDIFHRISKAHPEFKGFIIQTSPKIFNTLFDNFYNSIFPYVKYIELGIEMCDDNFLKSVNKDSNTNDIINALNRASISHLNIIPNIMINHPFYESSKILKNALTDTYNILCNYIDKNCIYDVNIFRYCNYKDKFDSESNTINSKVSYYLLYLEFITNLYKALYSIKLNNCLANIPL